MRQRVRVIWFPGLLTMLLAFVGQALVFNTPSLHRVVELRGTFLVISVPWLAWLAICGGLGAYCCMHEGGTPRQRLLVAAFPALIMGAFLLLALGLSVVLEAQVPLRVKLIGMAGFITWEMLLPGMALLMGATPLAASEQLKYNIHNRA